MRKLKILYAIQGTGNGHVSRARDFIPYLQQHFDLDILISGTQVDVALPHEITYRKRGASFIFGKNGGVDYWKSIKGLSPFTFLKDLLSLPISKYDLVINDFEPISAWAAKRKKIPVIALSHQCSFLSMQTPRPAETDAFTEFLFRKYAPSDYQIGFHFQPYDTFIQTPIIRKEIRQLHSSNDGHYTVYLPAYQHEFLVNYLSQWPHIKWHVFAKNLKQAYQIENIKVCPVQNENFNNSLACCAGLLTGGGFEAPAEALFLGKKVFSVPMKGQYEQICNAEALHKMGIPVVAALDEDAQLTLDKWLSTPASAAIVFPDNLDQVFNDLQKLIAKATHI